MKKTGKDFDLVLGGWLEEHRQKRKLCLERNEVDAKDFIDVMLSLEDEKQLLNIEHDSDTIIKSTCFSMILGGSDTTALTLTWAISLLLNHPDVLKKLQELDDHVGKERQVDESDLKSRVFLEAVIKETLLLYPAGPLLPPREAREDCVGHEHIDVRGHQFILVPFGLCRRSCPGISFALQVLHLTLARLVHSFDMGQPGGLPVDMSERPGMTLPKNEADRGPLNATTSIFDLWLLS
ncbi:putative cytochrome P450 [Helianthus anomalus]